MGGESGVEQAAALGLGLAEIISTFPCSRNRVVIRPGLETMVAIWSQAPREQSKHPSLADRPRGSFLEVPLPPASDWASWLGTSLLEAHRAVLSPPPLGPHRVRAAVPGCQAGGARR